MGSVYEVIAEAPQSIHEVLLGPCTDILRLVYLLDLPLIELKNEMRAAESSLNNHTVNT